MDAHHIAAVTARAARHAAGVAAAESVAATAPVSTTMPPGTGTDGNATTSLLPPPLLPPPLLLLLPPPPFSVAAAGMSDPPPLPSIHPRRTRGFQPERGGGITSQRRKHTQQEQNCDRALCRGTGSGQGHRQRANESRARNVQSRPRSAVPCGPYRQPESRRGHAAATTNQ